MFEFEFYGDALKKSAQDISARMRHLAKVSILPKMKTYIQSIKKKINFFDLFKKFISSIKLLFVTMFIWVTGEVIKKIFDISEKAIQITNELAKKRRAKSSLEYVTGANQANESFIGVSESEALDAQIQLLQNRVPQDLEIQYMSNVLSKVFNEKYNDVVGDLIELVKKNNIEQLNKYGVKPNTSAVDAYNQLAAIVNSYDPNKLITPIDKIITLFDKFLIKFYEVIAEFIVKNYGKINLIINPLKNIIQFIIDNSETIKNAIPEVLNMIKKVISVDTSIFNPFINEFKIFWNENIKDVIYEILLNIFDLIMLLVGIRFTGILTPRMYREIKKLSLSGETIKYLTRNTFVGDTASIYISMEYFRKAVIEGEKNPAAIIPIIGKLQLLRAEISYSEPGNWNLKTIINSFKDKNSNRISTEFENNMQRLINGLSSLNSHLDEVKGESESERESLYRLVSEVKYMAKHKMRVVV